MTFHNIARVIAGAFALFWLCAALFFAWAFHELYWRWRDCFNELGRCYDPQTSTVATDASFVWGVLAVMALVLASVSWMGRRYLQAK
jgi:cell division protein FtsX